MKHYTTETEILEANRQAKIVLNEVMIQSAAVEHINIFLLARVVIDLTERLEHK